MEVSLHLSQSLNTQEIEERTQWRKLVVSIIIPTLNEEDGIVSALCELPLRKLKEMDLGTEIIVVDGNSTDETVKRAKEFGANVIFQPRLGYGLAYRTGFASCTGDILVTYDGDRTYPPYIVPALIETLIDEDLDFITTNRLEKLEAGAMSSVHKFGNWILSTVVRLLFSVRLNDSQSGMWVIKRNVLDRITPLSDSMAFSQELKIRALRSCRCKEISIPYRKRLGNRKLKTLKHGFQNLLDLLNLRIRLGINR